MTAEWSALDTLKHTILKVDDLLSQVSDLLATDHDVDDDAPAMSVLDSARRQLALGLAEQIDGVTWDLFMRIERSALPSVYRYDDGSPVKVSIDDLGYGWGIFPRIEPDLMDPAKRRELVKPRLALVGRDPEGEDG